MTASGQWAMSKLRSPRCGTLPPSVLQNFVRLPAGGFGYFLSVSLYFSTTSSMGPADPPEQRADLQILVRVHLDVVDLRISGHGRAG